MKSYIIDRVENLTVSAHVDPGNGEKAYRLPHLLRHSPSGFEYGYGGSGPADLARSLVGDAYGIGDPPRAVYEALKWGVIARLDGMVRTHRISEERIREVCDPVFEAEKKY